MFLRFCVFQLLPLYFYTFLGYCFFSYFFVYLFICLRVHLFTCLLFYIFLHFFVAVCLLGSCPPPSFSVGRGGGLSNDKGDEEWEEGSSVIGLPLSFKVVSHREKEDTEE